MGKPIGYRIYILYLGIVCLVAFGLLNSDTPWSSGATKLEEVLAWGDHGPREKAETSPVQSANGSSAADSSVDRTIVSASASAGLAPDNTALRPDQQPVPGVVEPPSRDVEPPAVAGSSSIAYLVLGLGPSERPVWAAADDQIVSFDPPKTCPKCPPGAKKFRSSNEYRSAPEAWWCAQRFYMAALERLLQRFPASPWYLLADRDTAVFPSILQAMVDVLDAQVLSADEDLYMGHGRILAIGRFIMSGGGVLLRGLTLRRLSESGKLASCQERHAEGDWCWRHLDWVLADCLRETGVVARGHEAFQQFISKCGEECCKLPSVACHPLKNESDVRRQMAKQLSFDATTVTADWASPCDDHRYHWHQSRESTCDRQRVPPR